MAALDFPASPYNGQPFTSGGISWTFDGQKWVASTNSGGGGGGGGAVPIATTSTPGIIKPDGMSMTVAADGTTTVVGMTATALPAASALSATDVVVITQATFDVQTTQGAQAAFVLQQELPTVTIAGNTTLGRAAHHRRTLFCTSALTLTAPAAATLGDGFECRVVNVSSGTVTLAGLTTLSGTTSLDPSAVVAIFASGSAVYSAGTGAAALALPGTPGTPSPGSISTTTIALSWTIPLSGGALDYYKVEQSPAGVGTWTTIGTPTAANFVASGLTTNTSYDFRVRAHNSTGDGGYSTTLTVSTSATLAAPNPVTSLIAASATVSTITLSWVESGGPPATRTVTQRTPSGSGSYVAAAGTFGTTGGTATGLAANASYDFQVVETNGAGSSAPTTLTNVSTTVAAPGAVTSLAASATTDTGTVLTWANAPTATAWAVTQRTPSGSGSYTASGLSVAASATGATVSGLSPGQTYDFQVVASNTGGAGPAATLVALLTQPGAVTSLAAGTVTATTVPLTWVNAGSATAWRVQQSVHGAASWSNAAGTFTATGGSVTGLTSGTNYDFRVFASNATGESPQHADLLTGITPTATGLTNSNKISFSSPPASSITLSTHSGSPSLCYGNAAGGGHFFQVAATVGGAILANSNASIVREGWHTSPTVPPSAGYLPPGFSGSGFNGYITPGTGATGYFSDQSRQAVAYPSGPTNYYFWVSSDSGTSWSVYRDVSDVPIAVAVTFT